MSFEGTMLCAVSRSLIRTCVVAPDSIFTLQVCSLSSTPVNAVKYKQLDYSRVPVLKDEDLEEQFVRGSGPGGQSVNKTSNCVVLRHKPTGTIVKCQKTRSLDENRKIARKLLITKLDNELNGENSIESQIKEIEQTKLTKREQKRRKLDELKQKWKDSEGLL